MKLVQQRTLDYMWFGFMVKGPTTKTILFQIICCSSLNHRDIFTVGKLKYVCDLHAQTTIEDGRSMLQWHEIHCTKHSDLPRIQKYHNFLIVHLLNQSAVMKVR